MRNREIVVTRTTVVAVVTAVVGLLALFGIHVSKDVSDQLVAVLVPLLPIVAALIGGVWARKDVTPVADPVDADGTPLVPADEPMSPRQDLPDDLDDDTVGSVTDDIDDDAVAAALGRLDNHRDD